jgi:hypothetical protein
MIKHYSGQVIKVVINEQFFVDCAKYVSKSGATFNGCLTYDGIFMKETRGVYYVPSIPLTEIHNKRKLSRNIDEMKHIIENVIKDLQLVDEKLLIWFDNYKIRIYDKFKKGQIFNFNVFANQGNLAIYEVPVPRDLPYMKFDEVEKLTIYNHYLKFDNKVLWAEPYSSPGIVYVIYVDKPTEVDVYGASHGQVKLTLSGERYYLLVHPRPVGRSD